MQERDNGIELYRCFLMWGICLLHSISQGIYNVSWAQNALLFCVDGFIFITGYYGTSFKWSKIFKLYGVAFYAAIIVSIIAWNCEYIDDSFWALLKVIKRCALNAWFLNGYVVVLCFAPIIEKILLSKDCLKTLLPFICLVFGWAFLRSSPYTGSLVPESVGIVSYSGITLLGVYTCGRIVRMIEQKYTFKWMRNLLIGVICMIVCGFGFGNYASPFAVIVSVCLFYFFKRMPLSSFGERLVNILAPSLFAVYLLHSNSIGFTLIKKIELCCLSGRGIIGCAICSFIIFAGCLILDIPRRLFVWGIRNTINRLLCWVDMQWNTAENFVVTILKRGDV